MDKREHLGKAWIESDEAPVYYSNNARVQATTDDFLLLFGQVQPTADNIPAAASTKLLCSVYMSPSQTKVFIKILQAMVDSHDKLVASQADPK